MITILKLTLGGLFHIHLLVEFPFFPAEHASYFLCNNHEWSECLLQTVGDGLKEYIRREEIDFRVTGLILEHIFPDLVGRHEESKTNRLNGGIGGLSKCLLRFDGMFLLHFAFEFCEVLRIEGGLCGI